MLKGKMLVALVVALVGGVVVADDQSDAELKAKAEAGRVRTFSYVDTKLGAEFVYDVDAETAKKLPKGDIKNLPAKEANALEDTITAIRSKKATKVVDLTVGKEAATTACGDYYWYNPPISRPWRPWRNNVYVDVDVYWNNNWYPGNAYRGGSFYWETNRYVNYGTVWPYYGCYQPVYYHQPRYYWGC